MWLNEIAQLLIDEIPVLKHLFPGSDALALMGHSFSPDVHGRLQLLQPLIASEVSRLSDHASAAFAALHDLLEHDETFELSSVDVIWELALPLLVRQLDHLLEDVVESGIARLLVVLLDYQEYAVELIPY